MTAGRAKPAAPDDSLLRVQARALGDPTRHSIFRYLAEAGRRVDVAELAAHLDLNHTGIRQHLARLVAAGLVDEETAPASGRGRPRLMYGIAPAAESRWGVVGPSERLAAVLAEALRTGTGPCEAGRRAARAATTPSADPVESLREAMARGGFDPVVLHRGGAVEIGLRRCPFPEAAAAEPEIVCAVHRGIAEGVAELTGERLVVEDLVRGDPPASPCRLLLRLREDGKERKIGSPLPSGALRPAP